jgi:CRISPR/Cas system-associated exonuclease Cas4 (RecB family)
MFVAWRLRLFTVVGKVNATVGAGSVKEVPMQRDSVTARARGELSEDDDTIPIRMVEAAIYCPRQAWYRFVAGDDPINVHMQRGLNRHETFGEQAPRQDGDERIWRHLAVFAPHLAVQGVLDEVTITETRLVITEYKTSHRSAFIWQGVLMQLAVQHLALREHAASDRWHGPALPEETVLRVYYTDSKRSREVAWAGELAQQARSAIALCHSILRSTMPPAGIVGTRCHQCQHEPICLPFDLPKLREATR